MLIQGVVILIIGIAITILTYKYPSSKTDFRWDFKGYLSGACAIILGIFFIIKHFLK